MGDLDLEVNLCAARLGDPCLADSTEEDEAFLSGGLTVCFTTLAAGTSLA